MKPSELASLVLPFAITVAIAWSSHVLIAQIFIDPGRFAVGPEPEFLSRAVPAAIASTAALALLASARDIHDLKHISRGLAIGLLVSSTPLLQAMLAKLFAQVGTAGLREPPGQVPAPLSMAASIYALFVLLIALRIGVLGKAAFRASVPRQIRGRRALFGEAQWMSMSRARRLLPETGGIVIGERYRVDLDTSGSEPFSPSDTSSWGNGGKVPLLCFDTPFGSSHGVVFAGSGGFKTTSVTIPTALKWGSTLIVLDPSKDVAPKVAEHRRRSARRIFQLDPKTPQIGFNALDWIGRFGNSKEEDISTVASWIMSDAAMAGGPRDDFFRASAEQLITAMIADVCLSGQTPAHTQTLRQVRLNLSEPEPILRERLQAIHAMTRSDFVRENVAAFVNMTPETFSGVYANAVKETHWLSYPNYAGLVSGSSFKTDELADGNLDVFINIDLKTLETHAGLARLIIGAFLNAIYNRNGAIKGQALFLLDEAARLGYMRILETARDAGRKYKISLVMIFQSIGQMRQAYGGKDASSKWFESASWVSFAAINDPETADYIARRCGMTTVEADQVSRSMQSKGSTRTRSKQLAARSLILAHEVLGMRLDEQIVFMAGNPPLRCGRAIWFRRRDMLACVTPQVATEPNNDAEGVESSAIDDKARAACEPARKTALGSSKKYLKD